MKKKIAISTALIICMVLTGCFHVIHNTEDTENEYNNGYDDGYEAGYKAAMEKAGELRENTYQQIEHVIAMIDEIEYYEIDDIYDALCKTSEYVNNFK